MNMIDNIKNKHSEHAAERLPKNEFIAMIMEEFHYNIGVLLLGLLAVFFNYPLNLAMRLSNEMDRFERMGFRYESYMYETATLASAEEKLQYAMQQITDNILIGCDGSFIPLIIVLLAIISARAMFKHLFSRTNVDFYFSQPVSRCKRFTVNYLCGLLIGAICLSIGYIMALVVAAGYKVENIAIYNGVMITLGYFVMYALTYTIVVLAMVLTGNMLASAGAVFCFFCFLPMIYMIMYGLKTNYLSFYVPEEHSLSLLSPISLLSYYYSLVDNDAVFPVELVRNTALSTAGLGLITALLYRLRPAEACGRAVAFSQSKRPIRMIITVTAGLAALTQLGFIFNDNMTWTIFFVVFGVVITHAILEIIINADVRALLNDKVEMGVCLLLTFAIVMFYKYDCLGYDRYLPELDSIEAVAIETPSDSFEERWEQKRAEYEYELITAANKGIRYDSEYWSRYPSIMRIVRLKSDIAKTTALKIGEAAIAGKEAGDTIKDDNNSYTYVNFYLKDGKTVQRRYILDEERLADEIRGLFETDEYKETMFPILFEKPEDIGALGIEFKSAEVETRNMEKLEEMMGGEDVLLPASSNSATGTVLELGGDNGLREELLLAMQADIRAMKYDDYEDWWYNNGNLKMDLLYYACDEAMKLYELEEKNSNADYIIYIDYVDTYPIFESSVNTRRVLEKYGIELSK